MLKFDSCQLQFNAEIYQNHPNKTADDEPKIGQI